MVPANVKELKQWHSSLNDSQQSLAACITNGKLWANDGFITQITFFHVYILQPEYINCTHYVSMYFISEISLLN